MPNGLPITRIPGKTVYFLGAGFSAAAGIPTMPHFVRESFRLLKRYGSDALTKQFAVIVTKYRHIAASTGIDIDDIQELFSLVSGSHPKQEHAAVVEEINCLRAVIVHTLCFAQLEDEQRIIKKQEPRDNNYASIEQQPKKETLDSSNYEEHINYWLKRDARLSEEMWSLRTVPARHLFPANVTKGKETRNINKNIFPERLNHCIYQAFLSYVLYRSEPKTEGADKIDVIITPNYDLVVETALAKLYHNDYPCIIDYGDLNGNNKRVYLEIDNSDNPKQKLVLIKLHGSLNWCKVNNQWTAKNPMDDPSRKGLLFNVGPDSEMEFIKDFCRVPIVPPTWQRHGPDIDDANDKLFEILRGEALDHIKTAERIVIIGYSMPKTDLHIKYMMAHALISPEYPAIEIWDIRPEKDMKEAIETMFGKVLAKEIKYHPKTDSPSIKGLTGFVRNHPYQREG